MANTVLTLTTVMGFFYKESMPAIRDFIRIFFPKTFVTAQRQIQVDRFLRGRQRAYYRPKDGASKILAFTNGKGIMYEPPYIGLKTPITEDLAGSVTVGTAPNVEQNQQLLEKYAMIQEQQSEDIFTELVIQAVSIFRTGAFDAVTAEGQNVGEFDYGRVVGNTFTYDVTAKDGLQWLKELYDKLVATRTPLNQLVCLCGNKFINALEGDDAFNKYVDQMWYKTTDGIMTGEPIAGSDVLYRIVRMKIPGTSRKVDLISFDETYDVAGTETRFWPEDEAMMTSLRSPRTAAYAGIFIADQAQGTGVTVSGEIVTDRFVDKEPDALVLRSQTSPLLIPGNINHTAKVQGLNF